VLRALLLALLVLGLAAPAAAALPRVLATEAATPGGLAHEAHAVAVAGERTLVGRVAPDGAAAVDSLAPTARRCGSPRSPRRRTTPT